MGKEEVPLAQGSLSSYFGAIMQPEADKPYMDPHEHRPKWAIVKMDSEK